jgi:hypothetical protein
MLTSLTIPCRNWYIKQPVLHVSSSAVLWNAIHLVPFIIGVVFAYKSTASYIFTYIKGPEDAHVSDATLSMYDFCRHSEHQEYVNANSTPMWSQMKILLRKTIPVFPCEQGRARPGQSGVGVRGYPGLGDENLIKCWWKLHTKHESRFVTWTTQPSSQDTHRAPRNPKRHGWPWTGGDPTGE